MGHFSPTEDNAFLVLLTTCQPLQVTPQRNDGDSGIPDTDSKGAFPKTLTAGLTSCGSIGPPEGKARLSL